MAVIFLLFTLLAFGFTVLMVLGLISPGKGLFWAKFVKEKTRGKALGLNVAGVILCFVIMGVAAPVDKTDYYKLGNDNLAQKKYNEAITNYNKIQKKNIHYGEINLLVSKVIEEGNKNYNTELKKVSDEDKFDNIDKVIQNARKDLGDKFIIDKDIYEKINNKYIEGIKNCYFTDTEGYDIEKANKIMESVNKNKFTLNKDALEQIKNIKAAEYDKEINYAIEEGNYDKAIQLNNEFKEKTGREIFKVEDIENAIEKKEKDTALRVKYSELLRYEDKYKGKFIVVEGQVFDTPEKDVALILTGNNGFGYMDDIVWVKYSKESLKLVNKDIVRVWGTYQGEKKYDSTNGNEQTCVEIDAKYWSVATEN